MTVKITPLRILVAGWVVFLLYAYPGYIDTAAGDTLLDARFGAFGDWSSPVMARLWWVLGLVVAGPPGMLVLQSTLFLGGAYHLARRVCTDRVAAGVACGVLLFPPVLGIEAVVCAQSVVAGFALAGFALVVSPRPRRKIGGLALLLVAAGVHAGATFAVVPLVLFGLVWRDGMPRWKRFAIATAAVAIVAVGAFALERSIIDLRSYRREAALAKYDIAGIAHQLHAQDDPRVVALLKLSSENPDNSAALIAARSELVEENTAAYVKHRLRHLRLLLQSASKLQLDFTEYPDHANVLGYRARHSPIQRAVIAPVKLLSHTPLFRPLLYLLVAIVVLVLAIMRRQWVAATVLASGLVYELAAAFLTWTTELKVSHWLVVTAVLGAALYGVSLRHRDDRAQRAFEVDADRPAVPVE